MKESIKPSRQIPCLVHEGRLVFTEDIVNAALKGKGFGVEIEVLKWSVYQPRKDIKKHTWFRLENSILENPAIFELSHAGFKFWIHLLCQASKTNCAFVKVSHSFVNHVLRVKNQEIDEAIDTLKKHQLIRESERGRDGDVTDAYATRQTNKQDKQTRNTNVFLSGQPETSGNPVAIVPEFQNQNLDSVFSQVSLSAQKAWVTAYPDPSWICEEIKKALAWIETNPKRRPKKIARFLGSWFSRSWERQRKQVQTQKSAPSISDVLRGES